MKKYEIIKRIEDTTIIAVIRDENAEKTFKIAKACIINIGGALTKGTMKDC